MCSSHIAATKKKLDFIWLFLLSKPSISARQSSFWQPFCILHGNRFCAMCYFLSHIAIARGYQPIWIHAIPLDIKRTPFEQQLKWGRQDRRHGKPSYTIVANFSMSAVSASCKHFRNLPRKNLLAGRPRYMSNVNSGRYLYIDSCKIWKYML